MVIYMKQERKRTQNWKVGAILAFLFIAMFTLATLGFTLGFEATPPLKKIVAWITTVIAGAIGIFLVGAAIIDVIKALVRKRMSK